MTDCDLGIWTHGPSMSDGEFPIAVKANIAVRGWVRSAACPFFDGPACEADAPVIAALRAHGASIIGMTNMHELALGITSENAHYGPVRLPSHPELSAGGSSGGSAAAVAAGLVQVAIGTDTGGSVSIPASNCGVVGWRPSTGRWPTAGTIGLSWTRDTLGVLSRTVAQAAQIDSWVTGAPTATAVRPRIGIPDRLTADLSPQVEQRLRTTLDILGDIADLVEIAVDDVYEPADAAQAPIVGWELRRELSMAAAEHRGADPETAYRDLIAAVASSDVREVLVRELQHPVSADDYAAGQELVQAARREAAQLYQRERLDALAFPTTAALAPTIGAGYAVEHGGRQVSSFELYTRNTGPGTVLGAPMLTLPMPGEGVPVGVTLQGRRGDDARLLAIGGLVQAALAG